jgi:hypothetical protein
MKLYAPDSSHWYSADGTAVHTVPSAKDGTPRGTTLRDARKLNLLPSVTNILGVIAKPELISWMQEQAVIAALTLPRVDGESLDDFARRVAEDSHSARDNAAEFGTAIHHGAEQVAKDGVVDYSGAHWETLDKYRSWFTAHCVRRIWTERTLVKLTPGYAGTADLLIDHQAYGLTLVDIKTTKLKEPAKFKPYKTWCYQLAAYKHAIGTPMRCMNLVINSLAPSEPHECLWEELEIEQGWEAFKAAHTLWTIDKNYTPIL